MKHLFPIFVLFLANINLGNNNNNANNENMIMFTPMNGRQNFGKRRREAEVEWIHEQNPLDKYLSSDGLSYQIFFDSMRFYIYCTQNVQSNYSVLCKKRRYILNKYSSKSHLWRFTIKHILDGLLQLLQLGHLQKYCD